MKKNSPRDILSTDEFLELRQSVVKALKDAIDCDDEEDDKSADKTDALPPGMELDDAPPGLETDKNSIDKDMVRFLNLILCITIYFNSVIKIMYVFYIQCIIFL